MTDDELDLSSGKRLCDLPSEQRVLLAEAWMKRAAHVRVHTGRIEMHHATTTGQIIGVGYTQPRDIDVVVVRTLDDRGVLLELSNVRTIERAHP